MNSRGTSKSLFDTPILIVLNFSNEIENENENENEWCPEWKGTSREAR